jgi:peptidoglycan/LPS O-acetylase OafA/YrhL
LTDQPHKPRTPSRPYFPALDGLRGFAILLIILYHCFNFNRIFEVTWISLDLFFTLSGFLITDILLRSRDSPHYLRNFYMRRVLRIFPIYYISLALFLFILPLFIAYPFNLQYFLHNQQWFWLYAQNWLFILKSSGSSSFLNHYWSLALEEQFYLAWPWIILLVRTPRRMITVLLCLLLAILALRMAVWFGHIGGLPYETMYSFTRIDSLCAGSMLAAIRLSPGYRIRTLDRILGFIFLLSVLVILPTAKFIFKAGLPYFACCAYPVIALFWALIVRSSLSEKTLLYKTFNNTFLKFFGKISYGLYIFHWPVYILFKSNIHYWTDGRGFSPFAASLLAACLSTALSLILAIISYYCIEIHFLKIKRLFISDRRS